LSKVYGGPDHLGGELSLTRALVWVRSGQFAECVEAETKAQLLEVEDQRHKRVTDEIERIKATIASTPRVLQLRQSRWLTDIASCFLGRGCHSVARPAGDRYSRCAGRTRSARRASRPLEGRGNCVRTGTPPDGKFPARVTLMRFNASSISQTRAVCCKRLKKRRNSTSVTTSARWRPS